MICYFLFCCIKLDTNTIICTLFLNNTKHEQVKSLSVNLIYLFYMYFRMQISCGFAIHSHIFSLMEIFRLHVITMSVGNAIDLRNIANGGFNYVKSNNQSIEFYKFWYYSWLRYPGYHDQGVLNFIKHDPYITDIGLTIKCLSTTYFGAICEPSGDLNEVCTMHANCCIWLQSKLNGLRIIMEDWRDYMSMPRSLKKFGTFSWRVPHNCRCHATLEFKLEVFVNKICYTINDVWIICLIIPGFLMQSFILNQWDMLCGCRHCDTAKHVNSW
jgi:hypothetical protein